MVGLVNQDFAKSEPQGWTKYLRSPTVIVSLILIAFYVGISAVVGSFSDPVGQGITEQNPVLLLLMQCDIGGDGHLPTPIFPWTLLTSIFLHANPLHIASNLFFLFIFGFILEEQVSKTRWVTVFLLTGLAGSLTFAGADIAGFLLAGSPPTYHYCGVGASGAVYGIMGTALGLRVVLLLIFLLGLDLFAGGGGPAHLGGLVAGLVLRRFWGLSQPPKGY